ncbi:ABC transporter ATP-binding protein [Catenuloplanes atrovinosus]|uniref:ABC-2 type transport system ATP-binding protein n=1 Tax=Catenuloplanes atrovinosus TaxID=137266 RepID=A0AAE3YY45_9ACTN|nr:ATP-binding cassette domain-containing protein [Catenuloplanes atrovinosus]MDR7280756.1 ABC-2 type transport system ATP-binding protein [Catenuloplanes atrovinosus]
MTSPPAVDVKELVKRYPKAQVNAVDGISFDVAPGEIFGLLGPNGAGKSTTIGILTTRVRATSGSATVAGRDVIRDGVRARSAFAVVPQRSNLDRSLTPRQNLAFHAAYHGFSRAYRNARADELLEQFGLTEAANKKIDFYSGGMAQRLMIARAMMHEPAVLFLDEPTTGLDPQSRIFLWERVREMRDRGVTVVLTTHDMDEAAEMSDRVGIVDHGRLLALDTPEALTRRLTGQAVLELSVTPAPADDADKLIAALTDVDGVSRGEAVSAGAPALPPAALAALGGGSPPGPPGAPGTDEIKIRLYLDRAPAGLLGPVVAVLDARAATLANVHIGEPSLEDVFIDLTGRGLR